MALGVPAMYWGIGAGATFLLSMMGYGVTKVGRSHEIDVVKFGGKDCRFKRLSGEIAKGEFRNAALLSNHPQLRVQTMRAYGDGEEMSIARRAVLKVSCYTKAFFTGSFLDFWKFSKYVEETNSASPRASEAEWSFVTTDDDESSTEFETSVLESIPVIREVGQVVEAVGALLGWETVEEDEARENEIHSNRADIPDLVSDDGESVDGVGTTDANLATTCFETFLNEMFEGCNEIRHVFKSLIPPDAVTGFHFMRKQCKVFVSFERERSGHVCLKAGQKNLSWKAWGLVKAAGNTLLAEVEEIACKMDSALEINFSVTKSNGVRIEFHRHENCISEYPYPYFEVKPKTGKKPQAAGIYFLRSFETKGDKIAVEYTGYETGFPPSSLPSGIQTDWSKKEVPASDIASFMSDGIIWDNPNVSVKDIV